MMAGPIAEFVVSLGADGRLLSQGSLSMALEKDQKLSAEFAEEGNEIEKSEQEIDQDVEAPIAKAKKSDGKLIVSEEISQGHVGWPACASSDGYCCPG